MAEDQTLKAAAPATRIGDFLRLLAALRDTGEPVIIVGGHAVNLWAEFYLRQEPGLARYQPFTSRDLDLHRPGPLARAALRGRSAQALRERDPFGKAFELVEASFAVRDTAGNVLHIEALKALGGLSAREVSRAVVQVEYENVRLHVLHPIALLKAKASNLAHLDQTDRQDDKHFSILLLCVRAFLRDLLQTSRASEPPRRCLNLLELTLKTALHPDVLRAARSLHLDLRRLLPWRDLARHPQPRIAHFLARRAPQWRDLLQARLRSIQRGT